MANDTTHGPAMIIQTCSLDYDFICRNPHLRMHSNTSVWFS